MGSYDSEVKRKVCELLMGGTSTRRIEKMDGMPSRRTLARWMADPTFRDMTKFDAVEALREGRNETFEKASEIAREIDDNYEISTEVKDRVASFMIKLASKIGRVENWH